MNFVSSSLTTLVASRDAKVVAQTVGGIVLVLPRTAHGAACPWTLAGSTFPSRVYQSSTLRHATADRLARPVFIVIVEAAGWDFLDRGHEGGRRADLLH